MSLVTPDGPIVVLNKPLRELPVAYEETSLDKYKYRKVTRIGHQDGRVSPGENSAMFELQKDPNKYFPFDVIGENGEQSLERGEKYLLKSRLPLMGLFFSRETTTLPPGEHPVEVIELTPTSFTFTTLPGHFDAPGSTIKFSIFRDVSGNIYLMQEADGRTAFGLIAPSFAYDAWDQQAAALKKFLEDLK